MSDSGNGNLDPKFAYLEQLPMETLETLLRKSASLPETEENNAYVDALTEVIIRKEQEHPTGRLMDPEKSWEQFQSVFHVPAEDDGPWSFDDEEDPTAFMDLPEENAAPPEDVPEVKAPQRRRRRRVLIAPVAAVILLISLFVMQVSGVPLLQTLERFFAQMTGEVFRYSEEDKPEGCVQLEEAMFELGMSSDFAISWYPDEYAPDSIISQSNSDWKFVHQRYSSTEGCHFSVTVNWYSDTDRISENTAMKDANGENFGVYNGVNYCILPNNNETIVVWYHNHYSGTISGDLDEDDLMGIFQSMGGIKS